MIGGSGFSFGDRPNDDYGFSIFRFYITDCLRLTRQICVDCLHIMLACLDALTVWEQSAFRFPVNGVLPGEFDHFKGAGDRIKSIWFPLFWSGGFLEK